VRADDFFVFEELQGVTEFEFEHCQNTTIFSHPNPTEVERQFLDKCKFGFMLKNITVHLMIILTV